MYRVYTKYDNLVNQLSSMVTIIFLCVGISAKEVTTSLAAVSARSFPLMFVCPLIFLRCVGRLRPSLYRIRVTMAVSSGLGWWYAECDGRCS